MSNPFESLDSLSDQILEQIAPDRKGPDVMFELKEEERHLLETGWHMVSSDRWRHKDAPKDEYMSAFFADKVQQRIDKHGSAYRTAVWSVHFDVYSD